MYQVGLIGVTGYTGMELARCLATHEHFNLSMVTSRQESGKKLQELYPFLLGNPLGNLEISDAKTEELVDKCDLIFLAVPHSVAMETVGKLFEIADKKNKSLKIIDLSADFRIKSTETYEQWYSVKHTEAKLLQEAIYGLPEINSLAIQKARLIANPGCYPTASILGLYPAIQYKLIKNDSIIIDAKSGTSGAGRKATVPTLFCEVQDSFRPYSIAGKHRHTPEIEQELSLVAKDDIILSFNPHLLPIQRGILATIYTKMQKELSQEEVHEIYSKTWENQPFVRVLPLGDLPQTRNVRGTMFCDVGISVDQRSKRLIITSAIDNLARGASLQAVANANLMFGLPLETGINYLPLWP